MSNADDRASKVAIVFGASEFPYGGPRITANEAFARSADAFMRYLRSEAGLNLPYDNVLNLFDATSQVLDQDQKITDFLSDRKEAKDIIMYYVGHGGFLSDRGYFLALRSTKQNKEHLTGMQIKGLAESLQPLTAGRRLHLILDCCFAGEAVREFQTTELSTVVEKKTFENLPKSGTSLLIAASKDEPAIAPVDKPFTMFSESLLEVLQTGIPEKPSVLTLLEVGEQTRRLIESKYGLAAVRPEVHAPKQGGGLTVTVPLFPNPVGREQVPVFSPGVPLTVEEAIKMVHAALPSEVKKLHEIFAVYYLQSRESYNYYGDKEVDSYLSELQGVLHDPTIIAPGVLNKVLKQAKERYANFDVASKDRYSAQSELWRTVVEPIKGALPSKEQCVTMLIQKERQLLVPFLIYQYFSREADEKKESTREIIGECVERLSLGRELVAIPEREVMDSEPGNDVFLSSTKLARRILGAEFDPWYRTLRGQSYEEEIRSYEQKKEEKARLEQIQYEESIRQALDEFRPQQGVVAPSLNSKQAKILIEKLRQIIKEIETGPDQNGSVHRAKILLQRFSPDAAFRIHKAQIMRERGRPDYGRGYDRSYIPSVKNELDVVIEILEIEVAAGDVENS